MIILLWFQTAGVVTCCVATSTALFVHAVVLLLLLLLLLMLLMLSSSLQLPHSEILPSDPSLILCPAPSLQATALFSTGGLGSESITVTDSRK